MLNSLNRSYAVPIYTKEEAEEVYRKVALGALKYFILKVDPKKTMMFNPKESIDFNGNTGPFIQYTYTRIKSVLRKAEEAGVKIVSGDIHTALTEKEQNLVKLIAKLPAVVKEAGDNYSPALNGNYAYELAKEFNLITFLSISFGAIFFIFYIFLPTTGLA